MTHQVFKGFLHACEWNILCRTSRDWAHKVGLSKSSCCPKANVYSYRTAPDSLPAQQRVQYEDLPQSCVPGTWDWCRRSYACWGWIQPWKLRPLPRVTTTIALKDHFFDTAGRSPTKKRIAKADNVSKPHDISCDMWGVRQYHAADKSKILTTTWLGIYLATCTNNIECFVFVNQFTLVDIIVNLKLIPK